MDQNALRNFKDFLQLYNYMSHSCFQHCVDNLFSRNLSSDEANCVEQCVQKHIKVNHKLMGVFMELQPIIMNKRMAEMNEAAKQIEQASASPSTEEGSHSAPQAISSA